MEARVSASWRVKALKGRLTMEPRRGLEDKGEEGEGVTIRFVRLGSSSSSLQ